MTDTTPAPEHPFEVRFRKGGKITVHAAYAQHGTASGASAGTVAGAPVILKDADHKIVFLAPPEVIHSVLRKGKHGHAADPGPIEVGGRKEALDRGRRNARAERLETLDSRA